jgi:hypothetical protein
MSLSRLAPYGSGDLSPARLQNSRSKAAAAAELTAHVSRSLRMILRGPLEKSSHGLFEAPAGLLGSIRGPLWHCVQGPKRLLQICH